MFKGISTGRYFLTLELDTEGIAAAFVYPALQYFDIAFEVITDQLGEASAALLHDVMQMQALPKLSARQPTTQIENLRKMLLAMVTDVRAVLIILAERLWQLRTAKKETFENQQKLAKETLLLYAPLANRLGLGQLKWEMEDLCLRYLNREQYQNIATGLAVRREQREHYIAQMIIHLKEILPFALTIDGRVKHIYSIYRKMQRKQVDLHAIYDMSAVRIIVANTGECYQALSIIHQTWQQIPAEFDDYISHPKANGYRSIHTAIFGPDQRIVEVQIRTLRAREAESQGA